MTTATEAVAKGRAWLNQVHPTWVDAFPDDQDDMDLDMSVDEECVIGHIVNAAIGLENGGYCVVADASPFSVAVVAREDVCDGPYRAIKHLHMTEDEAVERGFVITWGLDIPYSYKDLDRAWSKVIAEEKEWTP